MIKDGGVKLLASIRVKIMNLEASEEERSLFLNYVSYLSLVGEEIESAAPEIMEQAVNRVLGRLPIFKFPETTPENTTIH